MGNAVDDLMAKCMSEKEELTKEKDAIMSEPGFEFENEEKLAKIEAKIVELDKKFNDLSKRNVKERRGRLQG